MDRLHIAIQSIHIFPTPSSASKISFRQFLLLQVIYTENQTRKGLVTNTDSSLLEPKYYQQAREMLDEVKNKGKDTDYWGLYLKSFDGQSNLEGPNFPKLGTFSLVRDFQLQCHRIRATNLTSLKLEFTPISHRTRSAFDKKKPEEESPSAGRVGRQGGLNRKDITQGMEKMTLGTPESSTSNPDNSTADTDNSTSDLEDSISEASAGRHYVHGASGADLQTVEDEQIVNTALILFLKAMTMHFDLQAHWSLHRRAFKLGQSGNEVYEARVDGYLCSGDNKVKAILEVKRFRRAEDLNAIRMQESAQMAAWISSYPDEGRKPKQEFRQVRNSLVTSIIY